MKIAKPLSVLCLCLSMGINVSGQTDPSVSNALMPSLDNLKPPSPNVAALNKFGDIPVGPSTGIPQVSVPVYVWEGKTFGRPFSISLDYHAGGIKVDEVASDVGLGWALNAGGVVSRVVRGIYDEYPIDGFLYRAMPANELEGNAGAAPNTRIFNRMSAGLVDSQCDLFNYSFNGRNGHFVLGKNNDILMIEDARLKISMDITNTFYDKPLITKVTITDEEGFDYVYSNCELAENFQSLISSKYTSAWHLSEIIHPSKKDKITFQYESYSTRITHRGSASYSEPIMDRTNLSHEASARHDIQTAAQRIIGITFPDGNQVTFSYQSTNRQDLTLSSARLLEKITISKGATKIGYRLQHDYSLSGRPTLLSVTEFGGASEILSKPYSFVYSSETLPDRLSAHIDHWGYANWNTGSVIPREYFRVSGGEFPPYRLLLGGNRDTHHTRVLAGSLRQINYPLGGYTVFEMEANQAKHGWLEQNLPVTIQLPPFTDRSMNEPINGDVVYNHVPFVFQGESGTSTQFKVTVYPDGRSSSSGVKFELYNSSNQLLNTQTVNFSISNVNPVERSFSVSNLVKNGSYHFRIYCVNLSGYYGYTEIGWREINPGGTRDTVLRHVQPFVGGIRVKRIIDYPAGGDQPAKIREYDYTMEDGVTSSGALGFRPVYTYLVTYDYRTSNLVIEDQYFGRLHPPNYMVRTSGGVHDPVTVNGSPVTYKRVVERIIGAAGNTGKTVRYFTGFDESGVHVSEDFPFVPPQIPSYYYGKLKREEVYDQNNTLFRTVENTYRPVLVRYASSPMRVENFRSVVFAPVKFFWNGNEATPKIDPAGRHHYYLMSNFSPLTGRVELIRSVNTVFATGQTPVVTTTDYSYDQDYFYLKETVTKDSREQQKKTVLNYPKDMVTAGTDVAVYQGMLDRNVLNPIIEEKVFVSGVQQSLTTKRYKKWHDSVFAPERIQTKKMDMPVEDRIVYLDYDTHGTPLSAQQSAGPKFAYVWSYGGTRLVAQVENVDYSQVQTLLGGANAIEIFRNKVAPSDSEIDAFLQPLINALPHAASITRFKHNTLQGLTSQTNETGRTTFYRYDEYNRLKAVLDHDGNLIEEYKYNYRSR